MIEFSKMKENDYESLLDFLNKNTIYKDEIKNSLPYIFLIKENKKLYGIGIISYEGEDIYIKDIYVIYDQRKKGLGEGLLRTILHYARVNKMRNAYYTKGDQDMCNFLLHIGFKKNKDTVYTNVETFFNRPCKNSSIYK